MSQLPFIVLLRTLNGLAGPLHGLASQEVLLWINSVMEDTEEWKGSLSQTVLYLLNYQALI
uniref:Uncharacterized protein n=2 Tax=Aegilops tauschii subsp. strangulata TaxID=200361 RepID=A0A453GFZ9_AEGTS